jgi:hypothetical protein
MTGKEQAHGKRRALICFWEVYKSNIGSTTASMRFAI